MVGYSFQNQDSVNSVYICPCCLLLLRNPVQLIDCGHRLCQTCANEEKGDMITCSECHEKTSRKNLIIDRGFKNDMLTLLIVCSLCDWTDVLKNYQNHLDQIHSNPICHYCEEKFPSTNDLDHHQYHDCQKITINCPLKQYGCQELILRINLSKHYLSEEHQKILIHIVRHLKTILPNVMHNHSDMSSQMMIDLPHTTDNTTIQLKEVYETVQILADGLGILNEDLQRLSTDAIVQQSTLDPLTQDLSILKISVQEQNTFLDGIKINQEILQQDLTSLGQKMNDMKMSSFDGTLTWKITNIQEKIGDAQSERQTSIYSAPFYSSATGYKMRARLYLNGDGNARRTHMSLFFVLMRGENDAILKFPFQFKVTFCLYDQTSQQHHIIDSFRPDVKSTSFQRPRSDMNIASGIPKFVPLTTMQHDQNPYVREDTMFIKVMLDFEEIPKTLLPYVLSLNPGLPTPTQQTMVRQEIVRRQQLPISPQANVETEQTLTVNLQETNMLLNMPIKTNGEPIDSTNNHMTD